MKNILTLSLPVYFHQLISLKMKLLIGSGCGLVMKQDITQQCYRTNIALTSCGLVMKQEMSALLISPI